MLYCGITLNYSSTVQTGNPFKCDLIYRLHLSSTRYTDIHFANERLAAELFLLLATGHSRGFQRYTSCVPLPEQTPLNTDDSSDRFSPILDLNDSVPSSPTKTEPEAATSQNISVLLLPSKANKPSPAWVPGFSNHIVSRLFFNHKLKTTLSVFYIFPEPPLHLSHINHPGGNIKHTSGESLTRSFIFAL